MSNDIIEKLMIKQGFQKSETKTASHYEIRKIKNKRQNSKTNIMKRIASLNNFKF